MVFSLLESPMGTSEKKMWQRTHLFRLHLALQVFWECLQKYPTCSSRTVVRGYVHIYSVWNCSACIRCIMFNRLLLNSLIVLNPIIHALHGYSWSGDGCDIYKSTRIYSPLCYGRMIVINWWIAPFWCILIHVFLLQPTHMHTCTHTLCGESGKALCAGQMPFKDLWHQKGIVICKY